MMTRYDPFEVGKVLENRLDLYEVVAIEPDQDRLRVAAGVGYAFVSWALYG